MPREGRRSGKTLILGLLAIGVLVGFAWFVELKDEAQSAQTDALGRAAYSEFLRRQSPSAVQATGNDEPLPMGSAVIIPRIRTNLKAILDAAARFEADHGRRPASLAELMNDAAGTRLLRITSVEGEDYTTIDLSTDSIGIYAPLGRSVSVSLAGIGGAVNGRDDIIGHAARAFIAFQDAHDGRAPNGPEELLPFFADDEVASRYEGLMNMRQSGGSGGRIPFLGPLRASIVTSSHTVRRLPGTFQAEVQTGPTPAGRALDAYKIANGGKLPGSPKDLVPFFADPKDAEAFLDSVRIGF